MKNTPRWSSTVIHHLLLKSLSEDGCPKQWKVANITPLVKDSSKSQTNFTNFRPISLTSLIARIAERIIHNRLLKELEQKSIITEKQFGALKGKGAADALAYFHTSVLSQIESHGSCHCIFMDIKKAFDRVNHFTLYESS